MNMKQWLGCCLAGLVCFCASGCVSTYDRPLTTSHYNRSNYVAPGNVHYPPPPQPGSYPPPPQYSHPNYGQHPTGKACKENKDCPSGQRCYGGSARAEGVCKY